MAQKEERRGGTGVFIDYFCILGSPSIGNALEMGSSFNRLKARTETRTNKETQATRTGATKGRIRQGEARGVTETNLHILDATMHT